MEVKGKKERWAGREAEFWSNLSEDLSNSTGDSDAKVDFRVVLSWGKGGRFPFNCIVFWYETPQERNTALGELTLFSEGNSKEILQLRDVSQQLGESGRHHSTHYSYSSNHLALSSSNIFLITLKPSWVLCHCLDLLHLRNLHVLTSIAVAELICVCHTIFFLGAKKDYLSLRLKLSPCQQKWVDVMCHFPSETAKGGYRFSTISFSFLLVGCKDIQNGSAMRQKQPSSLSCF